MDEIWQKIAVGVGSTIALGVIYWLHLRVFAPGYLLFIGLGKLVRDVAFLKAELMPNGGRSLKDHVARMSDSMTMLEARQRGMMAALPRPTFETDSNFNWISGNIAVERMLGFGFSHLERRRWVSLIHEDDRDDVMTEIAHAVKDKRGAHISFRFETEAGIVPVRLEAAPIFSSVSPDTVICWSGTLSRLDDRRSDERRGV